MTKHDYQAALDAIQQEREFLGSKKSQAAFIIPQRFIPAVEHALKLAAIVTGEPSEEMQKLMLAQVTEDTYLDISSDFREIIAEAQRQAEGVDG